MVNTPGLKLGAQACWFDSSQGYKKIADSNIEDV